MMNPTDLGYYEKTPGNGIWYKPGSRHPYRITSCEHCGAVYLGRSGSLFCSRSCVNGHTRRISNPSYRSRHYRVQNARGSASLYLCVDCRKPAKNWSQIHGTTGNEAADYEPRCILCHRAYDFVSIPRGERQWNSRLTVSDVQNIRADMELTQDQLAKLYNVSQPTISDIRSRKTWKHVA